jgi:hypothetical protein
MGKLWVSILGAFVLILVVNCNIVRAGPTLIQPGLHGNMGSTAQQNQNSIPSHRPNSNYDTSCQPDLSEIASKKTRENGAAVRVNRKEPARRRTWVEAAEVSWMRRIIRTRDPAGRTGSIGEMET